MRMDGPAGCRVQVGTSRSSHATIRVALCPGATDTADSTALDAGAQSRAVVTSGRARPHELTDTCRLQAGLALPPLVTSPVFLAPGPSACLVGSAVSGHRLRDTLWVVIQGFSKKPTGSGAAGQSAADAPGSCSPKPGCLLLLVRRDVFASNPL
jgi:hypothetical protein